EHDVARRAEALSARSDGGGRDRAADARFVRRVERKLPAVPCDAGAQRTDPHTGAGVTDAFRGLELDLRDAGGTEERVDPARAVAELEMAAAADRDGREPALAEAPDRARERFAVARAQRDADLHAVDRARRMADELDVRPFDLCERAERSRLRAHS